MEDLIAAEEVDLSNTLNIVVDSTAVKTGNSSSRRREKFAKNREKRKQKTKRNKESQQQSHDDGDKEEADKDKTVPIVKEGERAEISGSISQSDLNSVNNEQNNDAKAMKHSTERKLPLPDKAPKSSRQVKNSSMNKTLDLELYRSDGPRRKRGTNSNIMKDSEEVEKSAAYMATYHARPLEMDRRARASRKIQTSIPSDHIFGVKNGEEEDQKPIDPFVNLGLHERIASALRKVMDIKRPTLIQSETCRALLTENVDESSSEKRVNLFVQSETGSGKTLAYLLPILQKLALSSDNSFKRVDRSIGGTRALILCPTRELANQTFTAAEQLCKQTFSWLVPGLLVGGEKRKSEKARLRKGITILIGTCGRILDHIMRTECLMLHLKAKLEWVILDEADRLLDMGLSKQVEQIMQHLRAASPRSGPNRDGVTWRSILVSATVSEDIKDLAGSILGGDSWLWAKAVADTALEKKHDQISKSDGRTHEDPHKKIEDVNHAESNANKADFTNSVPRQLAQQYMIVSTKLRLPALAAFLVSRVKANQRVVIFLSTCDIVDYMHALFTETESIFDEDSDAKGLFGSFSRVYRLHGNVPHSLRQNILKDFALSQSSSILFATDVAARGLNLPGVDWILQYDAPSEIADFVHRAGRAARAGQAGHSLIFLLPSEAKYVEVLKLRGLAKLTALSLSTTLQSAAKECKTLTSEGCTLSGGGYGRSGSREGEAFSAALQSRLEDFIVKDDHRCKAEAKDLVENAQGKKSHRAKEKAEQLLDTRMIVKARKAFSSFMGAYPTKEKLVRHIFSSRALHLGHVGRSFALKDPPKAVIKASTQKKEKKDKNDGNSGDEVLKSTGKKRNMHLVFSNISSSKDGSSKRNTSSIRGQKRKRTATGSFVPVLANKIKQQNKKHLVRDKDDDHDAKKSNQINVKAAMTAAARRLQNGMEYF